MSTDVESPAQYLEDRPALSPALARLLWLLAPLLLAALAYWTSQSLPPGKLEGISLDWRFRSRGMHPVPSNLLLVEINEDSRRNLRVAGQGFDLRANLAVAIDRLADAGALAIGLDIWFEDPSAPDSDHALAEAISRANVVLAVTHTDGKIKRPIESLLSAGPKEGVITVYPDAGNILRRFPPSLYLNSLSEDSRTVETIPHFPLMLAWFAVREKDPEAQIEFTDGVGRIGEVRAYPNELIDFSDVPEGGIAKKDRVNPWQTVTLQDAVAGKFDSHIVDGSIVIVGESRSVQDAFVMPLSDAHVPGMYYHANALAHLLRHSHFDERWARDARAGALSAIMAFIAGLLAWNPMSWWKRRHSSWLLAAYIGASLTLLLGGWTWLCFFAFKRHVVLPMVAPLFSIAVATASGVLAQWVILTANARRLEERNRRIEMLFGQSVSDRMLEALRKNPESVRRIETRDVSVLFCDIRNFTTACGELSPQETATMLNEYFGFIASAVFENDGFIDKFIGDEIMAVFSVPFEQPDHPVRAVQTALAIKDRLDEFNQVRKERGQPSLNCGLGIHCGPAAAGHIGSARRSNYTVVGTTVNMAARIEAYTRDGEILISEAMKQRLPAHIPVRAWRSVELRGVQGEYQLYEVQHD